MYMGGYMLRLRRFLEWDVSDRTIEDAISLAIVNDFVAHSGAHLVYRESEFDAACERTSEKLLQHLLEEHEEDAFELLSLFKIANLVRRK